jgi:hypothetical protein
MGNWTPTHHSVKDGSPVRLVAVVLENEAGDRWEDDPSQWAPIEGPLVTKTGKVLTDEDIEALADEAERGYDVSHLVDKPDRRKP